MSTKIRRSYTLRHIMRRSVVRALCLLLIAVVVLVAPDAPVELQIVR